MNPAFTTKAATLEALAADLRSALVLPMLRFTVRQWREDAAGVLGRLRQRAWCDEALIVRSSAVGEDGAASSQAGRYLSVRDVPSPAAAAPAVEAVIASYGDTPYPDDEVFIQPMLRGVVLNGVAFSDDPNTGAPYIVVNYEVGSDTAAVTGGRGTGLRTRYLWKNAPISLPAPLDRVASLVREVETRFGGRPVDIEFALTDEGNGELRLFLLQARRLVHAAYSREEVAEHGRILSAIAGRIETGNRPHPYLHGRRTVFGVMPDWNPAEIIGIRPRPLALSLYRQIITDSIWAYQRHNYGYKNLRSFPLLVSFEGLPYIDVRVSFNSFIPADIPDPLAERLVDHYVDSLLDAPHLHDKVEFEIVHSCYTFDLPDRLAPLAGKGFGPADIESLTDSLRRLTNRIIDHDTGLCRRDLERIETLKERRTTILSSGLDEVSQIYWLLEDCKRYGTLPFAGLARGGFIAVQMLRSLVAVGVLDQQDLSAFMAGLDTVSARMGRDLKTLSRTAFFERYGHLRPGTYDILSPRYDEAPDLYFPDVPAGPPVDAPPPFRLSLREYRTIGDLLTRHGLVNDVVGLFDFFETGIRGREYAKFVFSQSLSDALRLLRRLGERLGFSADDLSYADIQCIYDAYTTNADIRTAMERSIDGGRERHMRTKRIALPPLIAGSGDVWDFELAPGEPNFITQKRSSGPVVGIDRPDLMTGGIALIPNADPGFDWIFHRGIGGFITAYGGVNSHMAIRASELGIPAVIGAGDVLFGKWAAAGMLEIDGASRLVRVLR